MAVDVNTRIVIATEAGDSLRQINSVRGGIAQISDARLNDLRITQAKARLELAEYKSAIAAQKAYNAEIKAEGAQKRLNFRKSNGATPKEIQKMSEMVDNLRMNYLTLANAEAGANLSAYQAKLNLDNLNKSLNENFSATEKCSRNLRKFSASATAARTAGRLFGIDVSEGVNPALVKQGIIVAGVSSSFKVAGTVLSWYAHRFDEYAEIADRNSQSTRETYKAYLKNIEAQRDAISSLKELNQNESLSNTQRLESSRLIKNLGSDYKNLGIEIDSATGKIKNLNDVQLKISERQKKESLRQIQSNIDTITAQLEIERDKLNDAGWSGWWFAGIPQLVTWDSRTRIGGVEEAREAQKNIIRLQSEMNDLLMQRHDIQKINPQYDYIAAIEDRKNAIDNLIKSEKKENQISRLKEIGGGRTSDWLQAEIKLREKIPDISEKEISQYKSFWEEEKKRDNEYKISSIHAEKMKNLRNELQIEKALAAGDEKRAMILKLQNELQREGYEYGSKEMRDVIAERLKIYNLQKSGNVRGSDFSEYRFRSSSQAAVLANSVEAIRLQSRRISKSPEMKIQEQQLDVLNKIRVGIEKISGPQRTSALIARG